MFDYVNGVRQRLYAVGVLAAEKLPGAQAKMKWLYDHHSELRCFYPGDQVLALLPVVDSPFQTKFTGPHQVKWKVSDADYLIATPQRKRSSQIVHVNLLKPLMPEHPWTLPD